MKLKNALLGMFTAAALLAVSGCQKAEAPAPAQTEAETAKETEAVKAEAETAAAKAADKEQEETTLTIPMSSCVTTLNRQFEITEAGWIMMGPIYDELFYMDVDETRYYLAESYEVSEDGLNVTVKLRMVLPGTMDSRSRPMTLSLLWSAIWIPTTAQDLPMLPLSMTSR